MNQIKKIINKVSSIAQSKELSNDLKDTIIYLGTSNGTILRVQRTFISETEFNYILTTKINQNISNKKNLCKKNDKILDLLIDRINQIENNNEKLISLYVATEHCIFQINLTDIEKKTIEYLANNKTLINLNEQNNYNINSSECNCFDLIKLFNEWKLKNDQYEDQLKIFDKTFNLYNCYWLTDNSRIEIINTIVLKIIYLKDFIF